MRQMTPTKRRQAQGFSIIELMVSVSIIVLLIGISYPFLSALSSGSRVEAGLNIVGMSADVARQWVQFQSWANDGSTTEPTRESYSGTAAIYCPTGEIRLVRNQRLARANAASGFSGANNYFEDQSPERNAYEDMPNVDYIRIPDGVGIVGIERTGTGDDDVRLIAPPFAIAFNELGQLSYGDENGLIYYDGDSSGVIRVSRTRAELANYDPAEWDGTEGSPNYDNTKIVQDLPTEAIECVPGVVVFSLVEYTESGFDFAGGGTVDPTDTDEWQWLKDNGQTVFFSPHTGAVLRDELE